jgi:hypothetical protein
LPDKTQDRRKTPKEDFKRFESFIDAMEDVEFEIWYNEEATTAQRELADKIREPLSEEEEEGLYP